ncbi:hypothetical protein HW555_002813 [Spodoptera exigua]|uniref:CHK kinase-like domain-containing protein n=1 Tax=Spodoptera exigua TaxID=7107 RepID=A0A835GPR7_SPOEX|nr:hypothetical protein HW555_002813 [Spodoptera exigua]
MMPPKKISQCHQALVELIYKLAGLYNMQLSDYVVEIGCDDVDSFLTGLFKVQLKGTVHGQKIKKKLLIKWHQESKMRVCFRDAYKRECNFYKLVLPSLLEVQNKIDNMEGLKMRFPNCIFASDEYDKETIVVQDLKQDGFGLRDRLFKTNLEYVSLVMRTLAKLHALSYVLQKTDPEKFEKIACLCEEDVQYCKPGPAPKSMQSYYEASVHVVQDADARDKLTRLTPDILTVLYKCTRSDKYSTICHGDCWNNNILYQHRGCKPVDVVFVDYQLMRFASPVTDIAYFLYMSTDGDFLDKHYDQVLDIYYGTLTAVLRHCNLDVNTVYPRNIFEKQLKEYSVLGLIEALVSMMIITAPYEDALKMTEMKYEHSEEAHEDESRDNLLFVERVNGIVNDFFKRNYSLDAILTE